MWRTRERAQESEDGLGAGWLRRKPMCEGLRKGGGPEVELVCRWRVSRWAVHQASLSGDSLGS